MREVAHRAGHEERVDPGDLDVDGRGRPPDLRPGELVTVDGLQLELGGAHERQGSAVVEDSLADVRPKTDLSTYRCALVRNHSPAKTFRLPEVLTLSDLTTFAEDSQRHATSDPVDPL